MDNISNVHIPVLFAILFIFILLNILLNYFFHHISKREIFKKLFWYWISLVIVFIFQMMAQDGVFNIVMAYSTTLLPMTILSVFFYETFNEKFPFAIVLPIYVIGYLLTFLFYQLGYGFTVVAMPFGVLTGLPLLCGAYLALIKHRNTSTVLQKFLGFIFIIMPIHCINFALFRMDQKNQVWGWFIAWGIYQVLSSLLPTFALEEITRHENTRLSNYIAEIKRLQTENETLRKK